MLCSSLLPAPINIVRDKTVTIYTPTRTHGSHVIVHLYIWQHFCTRLSRFKYIFHQVGSLSPLVQSEIVRFKHKFQFTMATYTLDVLSYHQRNLLFLILSHYLEILLNIFFYSQTFQHSPATIAYRFCGCKSFLLLISALFSIINKLSKTREFQSILFIIPNTRFLWENLGWDFICEYFPAIYSQYYFRMVGSSVWPCAFKILNNFWKGDNYVLGPHDVVLLATR